MIPEEEQSLIRRTTAPPREGSPPRRWSNKFALLVAFIVASVGATTWLALRDRSTQSNSGEFQSSVDLPKFGTIPRLSISYPALGRGTAITISNFETSNGIPRSDLDSFDITTKYEGYLSLELRSLNHRPDSSSISGRFDFSRMQLFEAMFKVPDPPSVESIVVRFRSRTSAAAFEYPVVVSETGWAPVRMMRAQFLPVGGAVPATWADIGAVEIRLISRPGAYARANVDLLRAEAGPEQRYAKAWSVADGQMLGLLKAPGGTALLFRNLVSGAVGTLREVADSKDFSLTVKLSPVTSGRGGLFFRGNPATGNGFSFLIGGVGHNTWQLLRTDSSGPKIIREGVIQIVNFRAADAYWLRAAMKGDRMDLSVSLDGTNFVKVAGAKDSTFDFGQVGLAVYDQATYAIYDIDYQRM